MTFNVLQCFPDIRKQDSMVELCGHPSPPDTTDPAFPSLSVVAPLLYSTPAPSLQKHMLEVDTLQSTFSHIRTPFSTASPVLKAPNLFSTPGVHDVAPAISQETVGISPQFGKAGNSLEDPGSVLNWPSGTGSTVTKYFFAIVLSCCHASQSKHSPVNVNRVKLMTYNACYI
jgi:hypothetical protein